MGLTHYWQFNVNLSDPSAADREAYLAALLACGTLCRALQAESGGLSGYSAHVAKYGGLVLNGSREGACEPLELRAHLAHNVQRGFVKTNRHPYDLAVRCCLLLLADELGPSFLLTSDDDATTWLEAQAEVARVLQRRVFIPASIKGRRLRSA